MRFGHYENRNLEGHATLRDWLLAKIDEADLTAPDYAKIVFILPYTNTRYTLSGRESLVQFKKKVGRKNNIGLGATATHYAKKQAGIL